MAASAASTTKAMKNDYYDDPLYRKLYNLLENT
jgi:hypothetical protein